MDRLLVRNQLTRDGIGTRNLFAGQLQAYLKTTHTMSIFVLTGGEDFAGQLDRGILFNTPFLVYETGPSDHSKANE